jgi:hypothetical protein
MSLIREIQGTFVTASNYLRVSQGGVTNIGGDGVNLEASNNSRVQFNDNGSLGGDAALTFDKTTDTLTVGGKVSINATTEGDAALVVTTSVGHAGIEDPRMAIYQGAESTTDATETTVMSVSVPENSSVLIDAKVHARRTDGGGAGNIAAFSVQAAVKRVTGSASIIGTRIEIIGEDQSDHSAGSPDFWTCGFSASGATLNITVTGRAGNSIAWHTATTVHTLATQ